MSSTRPNPMSPPEAHVRKNKIESTTLVSDIDTFLLNERWVDALRVPVRVADDARVLDHEVSRLVRVTVDPRRRSKLEHLWHVVHEVAVDWVSHVRLPDAVPCREVMRDDDVAALDDSVEPTSRVVRDIEGCMTAAKVFGYQRVAPWTRTPATSTDERSSLTYVGFTPANSSSMSCTASND